MLFFKLRLSEVILDRGRSEGEDEAGGRDRARTTAGAVVGSVVREGF